MFHLPELLFYDETDISLRLVAFFAVSETDCQNGSRG
jgi:hypothetical protein